VNTNNSKLVIELIQAIDADWAFCDKSDDDNYFVLINEDRDEHPSLKPQKSLIQKMESEGYIWFDEKRSDSREKERGYMEFLDEFEPVWLVFFYKVTGRGREIIRA